MASTGNFLSQFHHTSRAVHTDLLVVGRRQVRTISRKDKLCCVVKLVVVVSSATARGLLLFGTILGGTKLAGNCPLFGVVFWRSRIVMTESDIFA